MEVECSSAFRKIGEKFPNLSMTMFENLYKGTMRDCAIEMASRASVEDPSVHKKFVFYGHRMQEIDVELLARRLWLNMKSLKNHRIGSTNLADLDKEIETVTLMLKSHSLIDHRVLDAYKKVVTNYALVEANLND